MAEENEEPRDKGPQIIYRDSKENLELGNLPLHTFEVTQGDGTIIGGAELTYYSRPYPFYLVDGVYVDFEEQGKGHGGRLMDAVENFLRERKRAGVLVEAVFEESNSGWYQRRGWEKVPGEDYLYAYNLPSNMDITKLKNFVFRQTDIASRENWKNRSAK